MSNATFNFVEDYIEFIGGYREITGKVLVFFQTTGSPLSLARYDVKIIDSLAIQTTEQNRAYTDKQAELAVKIIKKYERQLNSHKVYLPETLDTFRFGIRQVDRSKALLIRDNKIVLKFPYDTKILPMVKRLTKESDGYAKFDYDAKYWIIGLTEPMLNWSVALAKANDFYIDPLAEDLYNRMIELEQTPYQIELQEVDGCLSIKNAATSLIEYVTTHLGGLQFTNLFRLIDSAPVLGYTINQLLLDKLTDYEKQFLPLIKNRQVKLSTTEWNLSRIKQYAIITNRLPIYVYDTKLEWKESEEIKYINRMTKYDLEPKLLVANTSMMIGPKKQSWLSNAEKIVILE